MNIQATASLRNVAIVGLDASSKTTLLESLLYLTGTLSRKSAVQNQNTVGDSSPEVRDRQITAEVTPATTEY